MDILAGAIGGLVAAYIALRMLKPNIKLANSQEQANLAKALKDAVDAMLATSADRNQLETRLDEMDKHWDERTAEMLTLKSQNEDLQAGQIATQRQIEALNRNYAAEISRLKHQWREWYDTLRGWLNEKGLTGYPEPPSGLLDTGEHKVGGEK